MSKQTYFEALLVACTWTAHAQVSEPEAAMKQLVQAFRQAEQNYDVSALSRLIDTRFVEVSPVGEVDEHDRFLAFYTPDKKVDWPPVVVSEEQVRIFGDTAIETLKFTYNMAGPDGTKAAREIRGTFTAQRSAGQWRLLGTQFTGIRQAPGTAK